MQPSHQTVIAVNTKSPILAFILTLLFGPLGFLYASIWLGLVLMVFYALIFLVTLGFSVILVPFANFFLALFAAAWVMLGNQGKLRRLNNPIIPQ